MKDSISRREAEAFLSLAPGDRVMGEDEEGMCWRGTVDVSDHEHGTMWIVTEIGERKLLDICVHRIVSSFVHDGQSRNPLD